MQINVTIRPAVQPLERGDIEDTLADSLGDSVEFLGGGTQLGDDSASDFSLRVDGLALEEVVAVCRRVLNAVQFTQPTELSLTIDGQPFPLGD